jgi:hypothetical protein
MRRRQSTGVMAFWVLFLRLGDNGVGSVIWIRAGWKARYGNCHFLWTITAESGIPLRKRMVRG